MQLIINETITQQFGVDAENDEAAIKALTQGQAALIPGSKTVSYRVSLRPQPQSSPALAIKTANH